MTNSPIAQPQDIDVLVVPNANHTGLTVEVTLPAGSQVTLKSVILLGNSGPPGPSDHVPSYAPEDVERIRPSFSVVLQRGVACGSLALDVAGEVVWSGIFHRFPISAGQAGSFVFVDQAWVLDVPDIGQASNVVLLRIQVDGPNGSPCFASRVMDVSAELSGTAMTLHFAVAGAADPASLAVYRRKPEGDWEVVASDLSADRRKLAVKVERRRTYALGM
jgi:hypothetical protein